MNALTLTLIIVATRVPHSKDTVVWCTFIRSVSFLGDSVTVHCAWAMYSASTWLAFIGLGDQA